MTETSAIDYAAWIESFKTAIQGQVEADRLQLAAQRTPMSVSGPVTPQLHMTLLETEIKLSRRVQYLEFLERLPFFPPDATYQVIKNGTINAWYKSQVTVAPDEATAGNFMKVLTDYSERQALQEIMDQLPDIKTTDLMAVLAKFE